MTAVLLLSCKLCSYVVFVKEEILVSVLGLACFNYISLRERAKSIVKKSFFGNSAYYTSILENHEA